MINEKTFLNDATALRAGRASLDIEANMEAPKEDPIAGGVQVAALGATIPKYLKGLLSRNTGDMVDAARQQSAPEAVPVDEMEAVLQAYASRQESPQAPEIDRLMAGTETTEDLGYLLELMGQEHKVDKRTHAEVEAGAESIGQIRKELQPLLEGKQTGLLTDKQLFGLRRLLVTVGEDTARLANDIQAGNATQETMAEYQFRFRQMQTLYTYARGQATEVARALNQQKMIATTLGSGSLQDLARINEMWGSPEDVAKHAEMFLNRQNKDGLAGAVEFMTNKANSMTKVALEYWKNNILSGVETHAVNVTSTAITNVWENAIIRPTAAGIGALRTSVTGSKDRVYFQESMAAMAGGWVGLRSGINMMAKTLKTGDTQFGGAKDEAHGEIHRAFGNAVGDLSTMSFRLLRAEDEFAKSVAFTQELYSLATRDGLSKGLNGEALNTHINELLDNPPAKMYDQAVEYAKHLTFTQDEVGGVVGHLAKSAKALVGNIPAFGFVMPFINTPANLLNYAMETSAMATISPRLWKQVRQGGAAADIAAAKMVTGVSLSAAAYQLYSAGILTGDGPKDYEQAKFIEQSTGWKRQGVKIGDQWYSLDRLDPFAASLAMVTNYFDKATYAKNPQDAEKHMANAMVALGEVAMDSTWMNSFSDFVQFASGDRDTTKFLANYATGFIPYSGLVKSVKKGMDPTPRMSDKDQLFKDVGSYLEAKFQGQIPGQSEFVRPARYWDGSIVTPPGGIMAHMVSPVKSAPAVEPGPVDKQFLRNGVTPREPNSVITVGPISFSLLSLDDGEGIFYDRYVKRVGETRKAILKEIVSREDYKGLSEGPGSRRAEVLERGLASAQTAGRGLFLTRDLVPVLEEYPELRNKLTQELGQDPIMFFQNIVESGMEGADIPIKAIIKGMPIRSPINMPGEQPLTSPEELAPRF